MPIDRSVRLVDKVVEALSSSIVSGQLGAGDRLPSERELCEQFGVSRPVVREAIGSLSARGLLESSPNRGHTVTALKRELVTESLTLFLRGRDLAYDKLMEVRTLIEVENAGLAATRATPEDLERLKTTAAALKVGGAPEEVAFADTAFHRAIATATGNDFFGLMLDSIREVLLASHLSTLPNDRRVAQTRRGHARILKAIAAGDAAAARAAMQLHLDESGRGLPPAPRRPRPSKRPDVENVLGEAVGPA